MISDERLKELIIEEEMAIVSMMSDCDDLQHEFSPEFEKNMEKLIEETRNSHNHKTLKRVACFFISICISGLLLFGTQLQADASILDWVKNQVSDFYEFIFVREDNPDEIKKFQLTWVPKGYFLVDFFERKNGDTYLYYNESGEMFQFVYLYGSDSNSFAAGMGEYEHKKYSRYKFRADIYLALDDENTNFITWTGEKGNVLFTVTGPIAEKDLIKIAESVCEFSP